jgi:hypothetical protein
VEERWWESDQITSTKSQANPKHKGPNVGNRLVRDSVIRLLCHSDLFGACDLMLGASPVVTLAA